MDIRYYHLYNRLVRRKLAAPLICGHDREPFTLGATDDGQAMLVCYTCHSEVTPGYATNSLVEKIVKEHFGDV